CPGGNALCRQIVHPLSYYRVMAEREKPDDVRRERLALVAGSGNAKFWAQLPLDAPDDVPPRSLTAADDIDTAQVTQHLYTGNLPDPDLILRTSGEERVSNFLLWQLAYSEFDFADVYWPALRKVDFLRAIRAYQQRQRRRGR
ncbi:MAG: undecaprenyl diphosphate synthase family protein, partial [Candidatus Thermoplasmatota archaeon]|nr:undecaprenyl diphosphate synthase family protein [Candidatus Thermoplasmatota archaeon]